MTGEEIVADYARKVNETHRLTDNRMTHAFADGKAMSEMVMAIEAELSRLRAERDALAAENRAMREAIDSVTRDSDGVCRFCNSHSFHEHNCIADRSETNTYTAREVERVKALEALTELVGESAPLMWVVNGMEMEASDWEKKAKAAIGKAGKGET